MTVLVTIIKYQSYASSSNIYRNTSRNNSLIILNPITFSNRTILDSVLGIQLPAFCCTVLTGGIKPWTTDNIMRQYCFYIDVSKAFDTVNHFLLLSKLQYLVLSLSWFRSYITERSQVTRVPDTHSSSGSGVSQASILDPLSSLFS